MMSLTWSATMIPTRKSVLVRRSVNIRVTPSSSHSLIGTATPPLITLQEHIGCGENKSRIMMRN